MSEVSRGVGERVRWDRADRLSLLPLHEKLQLSVLLGIRIERLHGSSEDTAGWGDGVDEMEEGAAV